MTGRPSTYDPKKAQSIIEQLSDGIPLREICRQDGMPAWRTVYDWMAKNEELSTAIARARFLGGHAIAEDALNIMDLPPERDQNGKIDQGYVQWQKNRCELRLKLLAKWMPKEYGDRIHTEHSGSVNLSGMDDAELDRLIAEKQQALDKAQRD